MKTSRETTRLSGHAAGFHRSSHVSQNQRLQTNSFLLRGKGERDTRRGDKGREDNGASDEKGRKKWEGGRKRETRREAGE